MCLKVECAVNDIACLTNLTKSVQWQYVSLPSIDTVTSPMTVVDVQTAGPAGHPTIADLFPTSFDIVAGNGAQLFDVVYRTLQDAAASSRLPPDTAATQSKRGSESADAARLSVRLLALGLFQIVFWRSTELGVYQLSYDHQLLFCHSFFAVIIAGYTHYRLSYIGYGH